MPEVSLLDPNEIIRSEGDGKLSYKLWRRQKPILQPTQDTVPILPAKILSNLSPVTPAAVTPIAPEVAKEIQPSRVEDCPLRDRIEQMAAVIDKQQLDIERLRNENSSLAENVHMLMAKVEELSEAHRQRPRSPRRTIPPPIDEGKYPDLPNEIIETLSLEVSACEVSTPRPAPDKSQMMQHLFQKYFPDDVSSKGSPSNRPFIEISEGDKSIATFNYLTKYKLLGTTDRVLDISKIKRQSKLLN